MSKVRDISNLSNIIKTDASGNVTFVSGSTTLMSISSSGAVTSTGAIGGSNATTLATTGSNTFTGQQYISNTVAPVNFTDTASLYTDGGIRVGKDAYVSGTLYLNDLTVYGTQSINYITSSQLDISDNIITVNTSTPQIRFGGIAVRDSGSAGTGLTGSLLWDSQNNHWIYTNPSGSSYSGGMLISGPRNTGSMGDEQGTTLNALMKGMGGDHITSSGIFESGSNVGIGTTNPSGLLQVGVANSGIYFDVSTQYTPKIKAAGTISDIQIESVGSGGNVYLSAPGATSLITMSVSGSEKLRISSAGNVGIGTTNPTAKLEVKGIADGDLFIGRFHAGSAKLIYGYQLGSDGYLELRTGADAIITKLSGYSGTPSYFLSNVGVGTTNPNVKFEVGATTPTGAEYSAYTTSTTGGETSKYSFWRNYSTVTTGSFRAAYIANYNTDDSYTSSNNQHLTFATKKGTSEPTEKMRITADGFVSIGQFPTPSNVQLKIRTSTQSSSNYAFGIDNSVSDLFYVRNDGIVIAPLQPSFSMGNGAASTGPGTVPFLRTIYNDGSHFNVSTYRFTAPAAGRYFFSFYDNIMANSSSPASFEFRVNGVRRGALAYTATKTNGAWYIMSFQQVLKLSASDYVEVYNNSADSPDYGGDTSWGNFSGHFLG